MSYLKSASADYFLSQRVGQRAPEGGPGEQPDGAHAVTLLRSTLTPEDFVEGHLVSTLRFTETHACRRFPLSITRRAVF